MRGLTARAAAWALVGLAAAPTWAGPINNGGLGSSGARIGAALAYAGDFNADGRPDLVVGAPKQQGVEFEEGMVLLYPGVAGGLGAPVKLANGPSSAAHLGASVAGNCDFNGDGIADVVAGAPGAAAGKGQVFIFLGSTGAPGIPVPITGPVTYGGFGTSVACPGDVDGDGHADLAVGAPDEPEGTAPGAGAVYLFLGKGEGSFQPLPAVKRGPSAGAHLGWSLVAVGDVTGDGRRDLVAGAPSDAGSPSGGRLVLLGIRGAAGVLEAIKDWQGPAPGCAASIAALGDVNGDGMADVAASVVTPAGSESVHVFSVSVGGFAAVGAPLEAPTSANDFGVSLGGPGDVNGDGFADLLVGAGAALDPITLTSSSLVLVYLGGAEGMRATPGQLWPTTRSTSMGFGAAVSGAGDVTGDGFADFVVGEPGGLATTVDSGVVNLFLGGARGPADTSAVISTPRTPRAVALLGDVNGDGVGDYAVGLPAGGTTPDIVTVAFPQRGGSAPSQVTITSPDVRSRFGASVAAAGDVNGDGFADLLVGSPDFGLDTGSVAFGRAYLYLGKPGGIESSPAWRITGTADLGRLGTSVAGAGDVNGDGFDDVVVGAPAALSDKGSVLVFHGGPNGLAPTPAIVLAAPASGFFGTSVAGVGDLDLDGFADLVVAAPEVSQGSINGRAYVYFGSPDGVPASPGWVLGGQLAFEHGLGRAVTGLGDVDGDRYPDFAVAATPPGSTGPVRAIIYPGGANRGARAVPRVVELPPTPPTTVQVRTIDVAGVGDIDGDGLGDLVLSCGEFGNGLAVLFGGQRGTVPRALPWAPGNASTPMGFGSALAGGHDVDGDGFGDFLVASQVGVQGYAGGDLRTGRPVKLTQSFSGVLRGHGYRAQAGEAVVLRGEVFDEVAAHFPLRLEVEVKPVQVPFDGSSTQVSALTPGGMASVTLAGPLEGRFHWRARVISGGLAGHWRAFGGENETFTDFSIGLPPVVELDGGLVEPDGGIADAGPADAGMGDGGLATDGGASGGPMYFDTSGCNCSGGAAQPLVFALLVWLAWRARRRQSDSL